MKSTVKSRYRWPSNVASIVIGTLGAVAFTGCGDDDTTIIIGEQDSGLDAGGTGADPTETDDTSSEPTGDPTDTQTDPTSGETQDDAGPPTDTDTDTTSTETSEPTETSGDTSETSSDTTVIPGDGGTGNNDPDAAVGAGEATQAPDNAFVLTTFANAGTKSNDGAEILMTGAKEESDPADQHELAGFAVANSIATFEAVFTGQVQSYRVQLPVNGRDVTGEKLLVRMRVLSSLQTEGTNPGIQLAAWSGDSWSWNDTYNAIDENAYDWVVYEMDLDEIEDPSNAKALGFQITTGGWGSEMDYPEPDSVSFQVDWVALVPSSEVPDAGPDGGDGGDFDAGPDAGWDDDAGWDGDAGAPDGGDAGGDGGELAEVGEDPPEDAIHVVTDMDGALAGYAVAQGSMGDDTDYFFYNSIARFTTPFTAAGQDFQVLIGTGGADWSGHDLAIRFRIISGLVAGTYPGLQLITWSEGGDVGEEDDHSYQDEWISINGNEDYSDWAVYRIPLDENTVNPEVINAVGFAINTGGDDVAFQEMVYEVDWIAVVPAEPE